MENDNENFCLSTHGSPIRLVFEGSANPERIAEFIDLLSDLFGKNLDVILANDLPPTADEIRKAA